MLNAQKVLAKELIFLILMFQLVRLIHRTEEGLAELRNIHVCQRQEERRLKLLALLSLYVYSTTRVYAIHPHGMFRLKG